MMNEMSDLDRGPSRSSSPLLDAAEESLSDVGGDDDDEFSHQSPRVPDKSWGESSVGSLGAYLDRGRLALLQNQRSSTATQSVTDLNRSLSDMGHATPKQWASSANNMTSLSTDNNISAKTVSSNESGSSSYLSLSPPAHSDIAWTGEGGLDVKPVTNNFESTPRASSQLRRFDTGLMGTLGHEDSSDEEDRTDYYGFKNRSSEIELSPPTLRAFNGTEIIADGTLKVKLEQFDKHLSCHVCSFIGMKFYWFGYKYYYIIIYLPLIESCQTHNTQMSIMQTC